MQTEAQKARANSTIEIDLLEPGQNCHGFLLWPIADKLCRSRGIVPMSALYFIGAIVWGSLAAQFLVQTITSLSIAAISLYGLLFARVKKEITAAGFAAALAQTLMFAGLFGGGFALIAIYFHPLGWTANMIAGFIAFVLTFIYCFIQVPDKILVAKLISTVPYFAERARWLASNRKLSGEEARRILAELRDH